MSPKIDAFVDRHGWQIVVFVVSAIVAWTTLNAQVEGKAERKDVERLETKMDAVMRMLCRDPRNAHDSACP